MSNTEKSAELPVQMHDFPAKKTAPRRKRQEAILIRLPLPLLEQRDLRAKAGYRSRTAEVRKRLEESMVNESIDEHGVIVVHSPVPLK